MGAFINDTTPEIVAERLRTVAVPPSSTPAAALAATTEGVHA